MKNKIGETPWTYESRPSANKIHKGFLIMDANGIAIIDVSAIDQKGIKGKEITKLIVESVNLLARFKI